MSHDVTVLDAACPICKRSGSIWFEFNSTYNLTPMFDAAGFRMRDFNGKTGAEVAPILAAAVAVMESDPAKFRAFDSPNGWGTYDQIMPYLREFLAAVDAHPTAMVDVQ